MIDIKSNRPSYRWQILCKIDKYFFLPSSNCAKTVRRKARFSSINLSIFKRSNKMGKRILLSVFAMVLSLFLGVAGLAQESTVKGNLGGVVVDSTGAVIPGAKVVLTGPTGTQTVTSENDGSFLFPRLAPGPYSVKVEKQGFKSADVKN